jgi:Cobalamin-independent synthase, Catalytic domain
VSRPWPAGAVTGIGSLPGTDPADAVALVFGELPDLPHLPELPERGAGADMIGRTAALLVDLPVELVPSGWQIAAHPGRDLRRASDLLARDLDALENAAAGYSGALKLQATGPLTLAAAVELRTGHKVVSDPGALRDLTESLGEGLAAHLADVAARVPGATLVLQLDEPSLPAVLAGEIRTPSGYGTVRALDAQVAEQSLRTVLAVAPVGGRAVHSCAAGTPIALLRAAGADVVGVDASLLGVPDYDTLGEAIEAGVALWLGVVPSTDSDVTLDRARGPIRRIWSELGFDPELLATTVVATPTCGFAGASPRYVRRALALLHDVGRDSLDPS